MGDFPRYERYKESGVEWLGEIPEHWKIRKLKHVAKIRLSNVDKHTRSTEIPVKLCNYTDVYYNHAITKKINFMSATATADQIKSFKLEKDDVLITKDSEIFDDIAVPAYIFETLDNVICGYHLAHIKPDTIQGLYLFYALQAPNIATQFYISANGITRYGISKNAISCAIFPLPPIEEQKRIADFLDRKTLEIENAIAKKQRLIELLEEQKTILINQAVTKGLNPDVPMKDSGIEWIGEIPEHWEVKKIKYISKIFRGKFTHRPRNDPRLYDGKYPFVQTGDIARAGKFLTKYKQTLNEKGLKVSILIPKGTVMITISANIGDISILDFDSCFPDSVVGFNPKNKIMTRDFLYYSLLMMKQQFLYSSTQNTQMNLNIERIGSNYLVFPLISQQINIVEYIDNKINEIDKLQIKTKQQIEKLKELKQILISQAVTGKIKI